MLTFDGDTIAVYRQEAVGGAHEAHAIISMSVHLLP